MSTSPGVSEFVSDAFDSTAIDQEDLKKEMEQLVLDKKESLPSPDGKHRNTTASNNNSFIYEVHFGASRLLFASCDELVSMTCSRVGGCGLGGGTAAGASGISGGHRVRHQRRPVGSGDRDDAAGR